MVMPMPSETIARVWHKDRGIEYENVDLGKCMEYDVLQINNLSKTTREANIRFAEIAPLLPDSAKADEFLEQLRKMESQMHEVIEATIDFSEADVKKNLLLAEIAHAYAPSSSVHHE